MATAANLCLLVLQSISHSCTALGHLVPMEEYFVVSFTCYFQMSFTYPAKKASRESPDKLQIKTKLPPHSTVAGG